MTLIDLDTVKLKFPLWENYLTEFVTDDYTVDDLLESIVDDAEAHMQQYSTFTQSSTTTLHLMRIIKYYAYMKKHDNAPLDNEKLPQIVWDYRVTDKQLRQGLLGTGNVRITSNDRLFGPDSDE